MKRIITIFHLLLATSILMNSCGSNSASDNKPIVANNQPTAEQQKPAVHLIVDGRVIESVDYVCMWILKGTESNLNLHVFYDREERRVPSDVSFVVYNYQTTTSPMYALKGKMPGKLEQQFSLNAILAIPRKAAADMNELTFSDNYEDLNSSVKLTLIDTTSKVASGSFEGTLRNANGKTMVITDGSFERIPLQMVYK
jgi:hypothetical protein